MIDLGGLEGYTEARKINLPGVVVGGGSGPVGEEHAILWVRAR
jgi:hypothetical protein